MNIYRMRPLLAALLLAACATSEDVDEDPSGRGGAGGAAGAAGAGWPSVPIAAVDQDVIAAAMSNG